MKIINYCAFFLVTMSASFFCAAMDRPTGQEFQFNIQKYGNSGIKIIPITLPENAKAKSDFEQLQRYPFSSLTKLDAYQKRYKEDIDSHVQLESENAFFLLNECHLSGCHNNRQEDTSFCRRHCAPKILASKLKRKRNDLLRDEATKVDANKRFNFGEFPVEKKVSVLSYAEGKGLLGVLVADEFKNRELDIGEFIIIDPLYKELIFFIAAEIDRMEILTLQSLEKKIELANLENGRKVKTQARRALQFLLALNLAHPDAMLSIFSSVRTPAISFVSADLIFCFDHLVSCDMDVFYREEIYALKGLLKHEGLMFEFRGDFVEITNRQIMTSWVNQFETKSRCIFDIKTN